MKTWAVYYELTTEYEAVVKGNTKKDATKKVLEVIGEPVKIVDVHEVNER